MKITLSADFKTATVQLEQGDVLAPSVVYDGESVTYENVPVRDYLDVQQYFLDLGDRGLYVSHEFAEDQK